MFKFVLFVVVFSISQLLFADEGNCSHRDFRNELPPIRNSSSTNWCFAYTSADLLSQKLKVNISAIDLGYGFVEAKEKKENSQTGIVAALSRFFSTPTMFPLLQGGFVDQAIQSRQDVGFCREEDLPSRNLEGHESLFALYDSIRKFVEKSDNKKGLCTNSQILKQFPKVQLNEMQEILLNAKAHEVAFELAKKSCKNRIIPEEKLEIEYASKSRFESTEAFWGAVSNNISENRILAVSLNYYALKGLEGEKFSNHSVTLVGRKWDPVRKKCTYLVRNSEGNNCSLYSPNYICESDGHVWIPEEILMKNISTMTSLK